MLSQHRYFESGATLNVSFRMDALKKLYAAVKRYEEQILCALQEDLGKSGYEGFMCEVGLVLSEISHMLRHIRRYAREKTVWTPLAQFAAKSFKKPVPHGNVLIMSPWNYPFLLTLSPLVDAIAAGNTAVLKPSAYAPATAAVLKKLVEETFSPEYVAIVTGGRQENQQLLRQKFDFIFFTGSQNVGREVLRHAAEHLTPVVLELGGKSPCIVDSSAKLPLAAKRIVFGKLLNCGQTCVAPDYVLCDERIKEELVQLIRREIQLQYGKDPLKNKDYGRIISRKHFERLCRLGEDPVCDPETLRIAPTVLENATWDSPAMAEEIFGPILPILTYRDFEEVYEKVGQRPKPLALYLFTEDRSRMKEVMKRIRFGGGCINDVIIHLATTQMGFGGVGESGMGAYHGKTGFDTFSHSKSIVDKKTWMDLPMRYQPYKSKLNEKLLHLFLK